MAIIQFPGTDFHDLNLDWVLQQVKNLLTEWASTKVDWEELQANNTEFKEFMTGQWEGFRDFVLNYLHNLPLTEEVSAKIDAMVEDGTLLELITHDEGDGSALSDVAGQWLAAHITQETGYVIDDSLTVQGAAADAKATGDAITDLRGAVGWKQENYISSVHDTSGTSINQQKRVLLNYTPIPDGALIADVQLIPYNGQGYAEGTIELATLYDKTYTVYDTLTFSMESLQITNLQSIGLSGTKRAHGETYLFICLNSDSLAKFRANAVTGKKMYVGDDIESASFTVRAVNNYELANQIIYYTTDIPYNDEYKYLIDNVLCIGDSLTQGYIKSGYVHTKNSYPTMLGKICNAENVLNRGASGFTAANYYTTNIVGHPSWFPFADYNFVIVWLGTNAGLDTSEQQTAYNNIISAIQTGNASAKIYLCTCFSTTGTSLADTNAFIKSLNLPVIDMNVAPFNVSTNKTMHPNDTTHFADIGYMEVAKYIVEKIAEHIRQNHSEYQNIGGSVEN